MSKRRRSEPAPPPKPVADEVAVPVQIDASDVEDIDFNTIVYDDVDGDVIELLPSLPAPEAGLAPEVGLTNEPVPLAASAGDDPLSDVSDERLSLVEETGMAMEPPPGAFEPRQSFESDADADVPEKPAARPAAPPPPRAVATLLARIDRSRHSGGTPATPIQSGSPTSDASARTDATTDAVDEPPTRPISSSVGDRVVPASSPGPLVTAGRATGKGNADAGESGTNELAAGPRPADSRGQVARHLLTPVPVSTPVPARTPEATPPDVASLGVSSPRAAAESDRPSESAKPVALPSGVASTSAAASTADPEGFQEARRPMPAAERPLTTAQRRPANRPAAADSGDFADAAQDSAAGVSANGTGGFVCPFCAHVRVANTGKCPKCTLEDTASTRRSTGERIGPWFVLQRKNPTAPGLRFSVLLTLARRGHVTAKSIVRGPTTGQLWRYAGEVKGLSRVFGVCWHCQAGVSPDAITCPKCKSAQEIPDDPDVFLESKAAELMSDTAVSTAIMREVPGDLAATAPRPITARSRPGAKPDANMSPETAARSESTPISGTLAPAATRAAPMTPARSGTDAPPRRPASKASIGLGGDTAALSASELAAVFQLEVPPPPGPLGRTARLGWRATKAVGIVALLAAATGAVVLYAKPEWRGPARERAETYWTLASEKATAAKDWTVAASSDAWAATTTTIARWRSAGSGTPTTDQTNVADGRPSDALVTGPQDDVPPPTPIRTDEAAPRSAPQADATPPQRPQEPAGQTPRVAEGQASIVDATPRSADPAVPQPATGDSWDQILAPDAANAANASGAAATSDASAQANAPMTTALRMPLTPEAEARAAEVAASAAAALRDVERAIAESKAATAAAKPERPRPANVAPNGTPPPPITQTPAAQQPEPPISLDAAIAKAFDLRQKAFDAEARQDWSGAVRIYEEIARLPEAAQPSDLRVRLQLAKGRVDR